MTRARPLASIIVTLLAVALLSPRASAECAPSEATAIELAKQGDSLRGFNIDEAISKYEEAHRMAPANQRILQKLENAFVKKEDWKSLRELTETSCDKTDARCVYMHGVALARIAAKDAPESAPTEWALARRSIEQALAIDPHFAEAHAELGSVALQLGDDQAALDHFTTALRLAPDDKKTYPLLAALYVRLHLLDYATRVLDQGLTWGDSYALRSIYGQVKEARHDGAGAIEQLSLAKQACGNCNEAGQAVVYFNLGRAQASGTSAEKSQAIDNLQRFFKMICKGAAASRYADQCKQTLDIASRLGSSLN